MRVRFLLIGAAIATASSSQAVETGQLADQLAQAKREAQQADAEARRLQSLANAARNDAARLHAQQLAMVQSIEAIEARLSAADVETRIVAATLARRRAELARAQKPVTSLLGGLAMMSARPPLLTAASAGGTDEIVRVRILLDATLPVIRSRTAGLAASVKADEALAARWRAARTAASKSRTQLAAKRAEFSRLEQQALASASGSDRAALDSSDTALAASETLQSLGEEASGLRSAESAAAALIREPAPPLRASGSPKPAPPLPYVLPSDAKVIRGLGSVDMNGIRARGLTLATARGARVIVPASGTVRFAGPFRNYDGVFIIDHGNGFMSLLINVASQVRAGQQVTIGEPLGRSLGAIGVELSRDGTHLSPALIAGSSAPLSKAGSSG